MLIISAAATDIVGSLEDDEFIYTCLSQDITVETFHGWFAQSTSPLCCTIRTLILVLELDIRTPSTAVKSCSRATEELLQSTAKTDGVLNANASGWVRLLMRTPLACRMRKNYIS